MQQIVIRIGSNGADKMQQYREVLRPYSKVWDEAILTAALCFIRRELGIREVFYHSYDTGNRLKGIERYYEYGKPPRYLYTDLPKKFCFVKTSEAPDFLKPVRYLHYLQRHGKAQWFKLPTQGETSWQKGGVAAIPSRTTCLSIGGVSTKKPFCQAAGRQTSITQAGE